jgi:hypothetical protein
VVRDTARPRTEDLEDGVPLPLLKHGVEVLRALATAWRRDIALQSDTATSLAGLNERIAAGTANDKATHEATLASITKVQESVDALQKSMGEAANRPSPGEGDAAPSDDLSKLTDFTKFHDGKLSRADQDFFGAT